MRVTFFKDLAAREAEQVDWTFEQLCDWIARVAVYPSKHAMPLIKLARLIHEDAREGMTGVA